MATKFPRRFDFARDTFAFANELLWEYQFDAATGKMNFRRREPKPDYAHRCFVLTRAARQFLYHAEFNSKPLTADLGALASRRRVSETVTRRRDAGAPGMTDDNFYRRLICQILSRNPRVPSENKIIVPGFASLREFSAAKEKLLKSECGSAWRSYVLRSHWRMIFPISRANQEQTAKELLAKIGRNFSPIVHLVNFPSLNINHGMILFDATETEKEIQFAAYDPNLPEKPAQLIFNCTTKTFSLPANTYWAGGELNVIEIFKNWIL